MAKSRPTPPRRPAPPPRKQTPKAVSFEKIRESAALRVGIYGPGGIGKTSVATIAPGPIAFFDLDDSLPTLQRSGRFEELDLRIVPATNWQEMQDYLQADGWDDIKTIVVDSATTAEEWAVAHTLKTVPHEKGGNVKRIEDYGFGKGYTHVYETFISLLGNLDNHRRAGRNVILICHDCTTPVPNPLGEDYIRFEPRLQSPSSGKNSIRLRVREWLDELWFLGYDLDVKDGKGKGCETRRVYPVEMPHCMAKSRTLYEAFEVIEGDASVWEQLFGKDGE